MKSIFYKLCLIGCVLTFASCKKTHQEQEDTLVFRYNETANIQTLDPAFARNNAIIWPCNQLFNGLVQLNDSLEVLPDIAKSWTISDDALTYTFTLRNDVYFHQHINFGQDSTRIVKASDFVYSFDRLLSEKMASPGTWVFQNVKQYQALNDSTLEIQLKKPFPAFLSLLSMKYASVVPHEITEDPSIDFRSNPIGTGPFYFKIWEENVKLVLRKNKNYYEKDSLGVSLPYLEAVAITFLPDKQSGYLQFIQGKLDFISGLDPSYKDDLLTPSGKLQQKYAARFKMLTGPYLNTEYLGFGMDHPVVQNPKLRTALNIGFDRVKMVTYLRNGMGSAHVSGIIPEGLPGFDAQNTLIYQPEKAKELVEQVKKETGQAVRLTLSTNSTYVDIAEFLQREWQKIGVDVAIDVMPPSTLRQAMATHKVPFFRGSWIADYPDAENYLSLFYSKNFSPNGPNYTHFKNEVYDTWFEESFLLTNEEHRWKQYQKMDALIQKEAPVIVLFYDKVARFAQKNVIGLEPNAMNSLQLKKVKKVK